MLKAIAEGGYEMEYGCIGEKLKHSFSAEIHGLLADYRYELCEVAQNDLADFMTERNFRGINVTIPYKERVIPYLCEISEQAREIGAVNTVVNRGGLLYGYNTDFYGMQVLIEHLGLTLEGKKVAILGTGGTSRTATAVARHMGAATVLRVSRTAKDGVIDYEALYADHSDANIIINTTPCGMYPNIRTSAIDISHFPLCEGVVDAVYNPLRSQLVLDAMQRGIPAEGGLYMLVAQAVRACEIFTDQSFSPDTVERVWKRICAQKENVVLIGMPGSGKSTVGAILSSLLDRLMYDTDTLIEQSTGRVIGEIFASEGEEAFRDVESRVIAEQVAACTGCIIATGGGAILRDGNVTELRRNGRLYFLDRPLADLIPTDDRPLAASRQAIEKRYEERYERYCTVADQRILVTGSAEDVARRIGKDYENE